MVFKTLISGARRLALGDGGNPTDLFPKTDPEVDGDACEHDCESCHVKYPKGFKIDEDDDLYGHIKGWSTHALVATGKSDWVRDVADEKGSVMEAIGKAAAPSNGKLMLSASNIPTPSHSSDYSEPTTVLLLPAFVVIDHVTPKRVPDLISEFVDKAPTNTSPLAPLALPTTVPVASTNGSDTGAHAAAAASPSPSIPPQMSRRPCPHSALVLLCSQKTRDARCGQSAPLLRKELERHLRPLGLFRDMDDERPGGVGIYFISHVGGHKYSANVMVYRRPNAFGLDGVERAKVGGEDELKPKIRAAVPETEDVGAAQCIWLARIKPEDCENLVRYTILQGKVVKPETQLRGGFDRAKGLMSW